MGCETPVVATDAGGLPEVVEHGVTGLWCRAPTRTRSPTRCRRCCPIRRCASRWGRRAASDRFACSTGTGPPSSSSRFISPSVPGLHREPTGFRVSLGRGSSGVRHRRLAPHPGGVPRSSAYPTPSSSISAARPISGSGSAKVSAVEGKFGDRDAVHLIKKTGWLRFVIETVLSRPVGLSFIPSFRRYRPKGTSSGCMAGWITSSGAGAFTNCPDEVLEADVETSYDEYIRHFGKPTGFSSPRFYSDERVMALRTGSISGTTAMRSTASRIAPPPRTVRCGTGRSRSRSAGLGRFPFSNIMAHAPLRRMRF